MKRSHNRRRRIEPARIVAIGIILLLLALVIYGIIRLTTLNATPAATPTPTPQSTPDASVPDATPEAAEEESGSAANTVFLDIAVDNDAHEISVSQQVMWTNDTGAEQDEIVFRMYPNVLVLGDDTPLALMDSAFPSGADTEGIVVRQAAVDGANAEFTVDGALKTTLRVTAETPIPDGEEAVITLLWTLRLPEGNYPLAYSSSGMQACWFYPVNAVYEDGGWHLTDVVENGEFPWYYPAANYQVSVRLQPGTKLSSTGSVQYTATSGTGETIYYIAAESARDFAFCLSDLTSEYEVEDTGVRYYALTQNSRYSKVSADTAAGMTAYLTERFGAAPFDELELVQCELAMDVSVHSGLILLDRDFLRNDNAALPAQVASAVAWQWLGGSVGGGYADDRDLHGPLCDYLASEYLQTAGNEDVDRSSLTEGAEKIAHIRDLLGEDTFDEVLAQYVSQYAGQKGSAEAFAALCGDEEANVFAYLRGYGVNTATPSPDES